MKDNELLYRLGQRLKELRKAKSGLYVTLRL